MDFYLSQSETVELVLKKPIWSYGGMLFDVIQIWLLCLLASCFQVLFTISGCDYISYFAGFGKAAFINVFYQHAAFIAGNETKGRLSDCSLSDLIRTLYFNKHYSAFVSLRGIETLQHLTNSTSLLDQHRVLFNDIRATVSDWGLANAIWISILETLAVLNVGSFKCGGTHQSGINFSWTEWLAYPSALILGVLIGTILKCRVKFRRRSISWQRMFMQKRTLWRHGCYKNGSSCGKVQETINFLTKGCSCKKGRCEGMVAINMEVLVVLVVDVRVVPIFQ